MKRISFVVILYLMFQQLNAGVLPQEYYDIKSKLDIQSEGDTNAMNIYKKKDLPLIFKMADILKTYSGENDELYNERMFVVDAVFQLLPVTEYLGMHKGFRDGMDASLDDYAKCAEPKRSYLLLARNWSKDRVVRYFIDLGTTSDKAAKIAEATSLLSSNATYKRGKEECEKLFDEGVFNMSFIYRYLNTFYVYEKDYKMIRKFYKKYFDKIPPGEFDEYQVGPVIGLIIFYNKKLKKEVVDKLLDKLNNSPEAVFKTEIFHGGTNDALLKILCDAEIVSDLRLNDKVINFFRINKDILDNRELLMSNTTVVKDYLILNADKIGISPETRKIIEDPYIK